jgi:hypothetical protein
LTRKQRKLLTGNLPSRSDEGGKMEIEWILKSEILVIKGTGEYEVTEIGGTRKCVIKMSDAGRMLFDGKDIETEDFMAYVGLLDMVDDAENGVVFLDGDTGFAF